MASVYHVTSTDRLASIEQAGLRPDIYSAHRLDSRSDWGRFELEIESICPPYLRDVGVTRKFATFAHADEASSVAWYGRCTMGGVPSKRRLAILAVAIDPRNTFVADASLATRRTATEYWAGTITVHQLWEQYEPTPTGAWQRTHLGQFGWNEMPEYYTMPEVIIPDLVEPNRLAVHSLSLYPIKTQTSWYF
ncbi:MAG: hypothetical protein QG629_265 [Patescibacteria group bacterium]|nr:hypothetical protein [Candidatus Saccharibacteria bacterium]MDQ5963183.1 hypothetical protein [Patescibacteria group bacterium]